MKQRSHCIECGLAFGLVERSADYASTCKECVAKLRGPLAVCRHCARAVEINHEAHLHCYAVVVYCQACVDELRELELLEHAEEKAAIIAGWTTMRASIAR